MSAPTRSSARLREKREVASNAASLVRTKQQPARPQASTRSTKKTAVAKRSKINHINKEPNNPLGKATSRLGDRARIGEGSYLKQLGEIPMDVGYEIFGYLELLDLLHLSWSNKELRSMVMRKSARFIWENAFKVLYASTNPPPPCPSDLNLAQYARLLFDKRCMECNIQQGSHVLWPHRLRLCYYCLNGGRFIALVTVSKDWQGLPVLRADVYGGGFGYILRSELNEVQTKKSYMHPSSGEWTEFVARREKWNNARKSDERKYADWQRKREQEEREHLDRIKDERRVKIVARLGELGWKDELDRMTVNQIRCLPGVNVAKPLTEEIWELVCPDILGRLDALKERRLEKEEQGRIVDRCRALSKLVTAWSRKLSKLKYMLPKVLDIAFNEPFQSYIFEDSDTEPTYLSNKDEFDKLMVQASSKWHSMRTQYLFLLLPSNTPKKHGDIFASLNLATCFYKCSAGAGDCPSGRDALTPAEALVHECQHMMAKQGNRRPTDSEGLGKLSNGKFQRPWLGDCQDLSFDHEASDAAKMIVHLCGQDPAVATNDKMDELNARFECVRCVDPIGERFIMKWNMAVQHEVEKHPVQTWGVMTQVRVPEPVETKWRLITDKSTLSLTQQQENILRAGGIAFQLNGVLVVGGPGGLHLM